MSLPSSLYGLSDLWICRAFRRLRSLVCSIALDGTFDANARQVSYPRQGGGNLDGPEYDVGRVAPLAHVALVQVVARYQYRRGSFDESGYSPDHAHRPARDIGSAGDRRLAGHLEGG